MRAGGDHGLLHLDPARFDLREEHAAIVGALVRLHRSAVNPKPTGRLDDHEIRSLHERVARHYGFDVRHLVHAELERLADERRQPSRRFSGLAPLREDADVTPVPGARPID